MVNSTQTVPGVPEHIQASPHVVQVPTTSHSTGEETGGLGLKTRASVKSQITGTSAHQHTLLTEGQLPELFGKRPLFTPEDTLLGNAPNGNKPEIPTKIPT